MEWKAFAAMIVLAVALVIGLITVIYTSVSKYARRLDPGARGVPPRSDNQHLM
jgi:hypothetical protein